MPRRFVYSFDPPRDDPVGGATVELTVAEIEDAGLKEVLQTPGAALGTWALLDALLHPTGPGSPFLFREPLGQAREVKVALSGLFGRFVARAYLERYFDLSIFAHLGRSEIMLDRRRRVSVVRRAPGDLPDWIACKADLSGLTVAEAKGCHDSAGPGQALGRAWAQVHRADVTAHGRRLTAKRIAVATRWGSLVGGAPDSRLSVRDPLDEGDPVDPQDGDAAYIGLVRRHVASLLAPLGHRELAEQLRMLSSTPFAPTRERARRQAADVLARASVGAGLDAVGLATGTDLIGGIVTRAGPLLEPVLTSADQQQLRRLSLRPVFVGIERKLVKAALDDDPEPMRAAASLERPRRDRARSDQGGSWVVELGDREESQEG